jgi:inosine/xanthosine triphosphatase
MKVLIGTNNNVKVEACQAAFDNYFAGVEVITVNVPSEVSEMPLNDEITIGVRNRIKNLRRYAEDNNIEVDYYVAVESGINNFFDEWMITAVAGIENDSGLKSYSTSPSYPIPGDMVDEIIHDGLGPVMDRIFADDDSGHRKGGIGFLTHGKIRRYNLLEESFMMALIRVINNNW